VKTKPVYRYTESSCRMQYFLIWQAKRESMSEIVLDLVSCVRDYDLRLRAPDKLFQVNSGY
jgi:hypothetical protein